MKLLLVDGNSLFYKSYYGTSFRLKQGAERLKDGTPVNALRAFAMMIINLRTHYPSDKILITFDERDTVTYRNEYTFYKSNRKPQPDDLYAQTPLVKEFLELYGIKWYSTNKLEADDVIGILAKEAKKEGYFVEIVTSDKDLLQLVDHGVDVLLSHKGVSDMERYTIDNFAEKFHGLQPFQVIEIKAIMGDASDNIPGIKGIGTLGAIDLLKEFNDLDNIYKNLDKITGARKAKLIRSKEIAYISKSVATIVTTTEKEIDFEEMKINKPNFKHLMPFLKEKKLYNIMGRISNKWK